MGSKMSNVNTVSSMSQISAVLAYCGYSLSQAAKVIAYKSRGKMFITVSDEDCLVLKKYYQQSKGAQLEEVNCTPRDFKNVCVWLNTDARDCGIELNLRAEDTLS